MVFKNSYWNLVVKEWFKLNFKKTDLSQNSTNFSATVFTPNHYSTQSQLGSAQKKKDSCPCLCCAKIRYTSAAADVPTHDPAPQSKVLPHIDAFLKDFCTY